MRLFTEYRDEIRAGLTEAPDINKLQKFGLVMLIIGGVYIDRTERKLISTYPVLDSPEVAWDGSGFDPKLLDLELANIIEGSENES